MAKYGKFTGFPKSYKLTPRGIVFYEYAEKGIPFIAPPSVNTLVGMITDFLKQIDYNTDEFLFMDKFNNGDGSNYKGWMITTDTEDLHDSDAYFAVFAHWIYYAK